MTLVDKYKKFIFKVGLSPGDIVMLTAAIRDLKLGHPYLDIDVRTPAGEIWENNPHLSELDEKDPSVKSLYLDYPLIHDSNEGQYHFIHGYRKDIEHKLGISIKPTKFKGDIHISDTEKSWISQLEEMSIKDDFWIIMSGGKSDFTCKFWNPKYMQEVVDHFKGLITFVQCGSNEKNKDVEHIHPTLDGVINLIGRTDLRQFIRLIYHSVGVICPVTFSMHAAAAIEMKKTPPINRPCVVIAGGREPPQWEEYPNHKFLSTNGCLDCCDNGGCWKSRCQTIGDGDPKDQEKELCIYRVKVSDNLVIPKCMDMIKPKDVIRAIEQYYEGGVLKYNGNNPNK